MDELPSAAFRKQYAKLTKPTLVTVNGHPIGRWMPANGLVEMIEEPARYVADEDVVDYTLGTPEQQRSAAARIEAGKPDATMIGFNTRPFTPVPKVRKP